MIIVSFNLSEKFRSTASVFLLGCHFLLFLVCIGVLVIAAIVYHFYHAYRKILRSGSIVIVCSVILGHGILLCILHLYGIRVYVGCCNWRTQYKYKHVWMTRPRVYLCVQLGFIVVIIIIVVVVPQQRGTIMKELQEDITQAFWGYSEDYLIKSQLDQLQIHFECCGIISPADWFYNRWIPEPFSTLPAAIYQAPLTEYFSDSLPFSCCDYRSRRPCVRDQVLSSIDHFNYSPTLNQTYYIQGCVANVKGYVSDILLQDYLYLTWGILAVELITVLLFRFVQSSSRLAIQWGDPTATAPGYLVRCGSAPDPPGWDSTLEFSLKGSEPASLSEVKVETGAPPGPSSEDKPTGTITKNPDPLVVTPPVSQADHQRSDVSNQVSSSDINQSSHPLTNLPPPSSFQNMRPRLSEDSGKIAYVNNNSIVGSYTIEMLPHENSNNKSNVMRTNPQRDGAVRVERNSSAVNEATYLKSRHSADQEQSRGSVAHNQSSVSVAHDQLRGSVAHDQLKGLLAHDQSRGLMAHVPSRGSVAPDQSSVSVTHDKLRGSVAHAQLRDSVARDKSMNLMAHDQSRDSLAHDQLRGSVAHDQLRGSVAHTQSRDSMTHGQSRDSVAHVPSRGSVAHDHLRVSVAHDKSRDSVTHNQSRDLVANDQSRVSMAHDTPDSASNKTNKTSNNCIHMNSEYMVSLSLENNPSAQGRPVQETPLALSTAVQRESGQVFNLQDQGLHGLAAEGAVGFNMNQAPSLVQNVSSGSRPMSLLNLQGQGFQRRAEAAGDAAGFNTRHFQSEVQNDSRDSRQVPVLYLEGQAPAAAAAAAAGAAAGFNINQSQSEIQNISSGSQNLPDLIVPRQSPQESIQIQPSAAASNAASVFCNEINLENNGDFATGAHSNMLSSDDLATGDSRRRMGSEFGLENENEVVRKDDSKQNGPSSKCVGDAGCTERKYMHSPSETNSPIYSSSPRYNVRENEDKKYNNLLVGLSRKNEASRHPSSQHADSKDSSRNPPIQHADLKDSSRHPSSQHADRKDSSRHPASQHAEALYIDEGRRRGDNSTIRKSPTAMTSTSDTSISERHFSRKTNFQSAYVERNFVRDKQSDRAACHRHIATSSGSESDETKQYNEKCSQVRWEKEKERNNWSNNTLSTCSTCRSCSSESTLVEIGHGQKSRKIVQSDPTKVKENKQSQSKIKENGKHVERSNAKKVDKGKVEERGKNHNDSNINNSSNKNGNLNSNENIGTNEGLNGNKNCNNNSTEQFNSVSDPYSQANTANNFNYTGGDPGNWNNSYDWSNNQYGWNYGPPNGPNGWCNGPNGWNYQNGPNSWTSQSGPNGWNNQSGPNGWSNQNGPNVWTNQSGPNGWSNQNGPYSWNENPNGQFYWNGNSSFNWNFNPNNPNGYNGNPNMVYNCNTNPNIPGNSKGNPNNLSIKSDATQNANGFSNTNSKVSENHQSSKTRDSIIHRDGDGQRLKGNDYSNFNNIRESKHNPTQKNSMNSMKKCSKSNAEHFSKSQHSKHKPQHSKHTKYANNIDNKQHNNNHESIKSTHKHRSTASKKQDKGTDNVKSQFDVKSQLSKHVLLEDMIDYSECKRDSDDSLFTKSINSQSSQNDIKQERRKNGGDHNSRKIKSTSGDFNSRFRGDSDIKQHGDCRKRDTEISGRSIKPTSGDFNADSHSQSVIKKRTSSRERGQDDTRWKIFDKYSFDNKPASKYNNPGEIFYSKYQNRNDDCSTIDESKVQSSSELESNVCDSATGLNNSDSTESTVTMVKSKYESTSTASTRKEKLSKIGLLNRDEEKFENSRVSEIKGSGRTADFLGYNNNKSKNNKSNDKLLVTCNGSKESEIEIESPETNIKVYMTNEDLIPSQSKMKVPVCVEGHPTSKFNQSHNSIKKSDPGTSSEKLNPSKQEEVINHPGEMKGSGTTEELLSNSNNKRKKKESKKEMIKVMTNLLKELICEDEESGSSENSERNANTGVNHSNGPDKEINKEMDREIDRERKGEIDSELNRENKLIRAVVDTSVHDKDRQIQCNDVFERNLNFVRSKQEEEEEEEDGEQEQEQIQEQEVEDIKEKMRKQKVVIEQKSFKIRDSARKKVKQEPKNLAIQKNRQLKKNRENIQISGAKQILSVKKIKTENIDKRAICMDWIDKVARSEVTVDNAGDLNAFVKLNDEQASKTTDKNIPKAGKIKNIEKFNRTNYAVENENIDQAADQEVFQHKLKSVRHTVKHLNGTCNTQLDQSKSLKATERIVSLHNECSENEKLCRTENSAKQNRKRNNVTTGKTSSKRVSESGVDVNSNKNNCRADNISPSVSDELPKPSQMRNLELSKQGRNRDSRITAKTSGSRLSESDFDDNEDKNYSRVDKISQTSSDGFGKSAQQRYLSNRHDNIKQKKQPIPPITDHPRKLQSCKRDGRFESDNVVVCRHEGEMKGSGNTARLLGYDNNNIKQNDPEVNLSNQSINPFINPSISTNPMEVLNKPPLCKRSSVSRSLSVDNYPNTEHSRERIPRNKAKVRQDQKQYNQDGAAEIVAFNKFGFENKQSNNNYSGLVNMGEIDSDKLGRRLIFKRDDVGNFERRSVSTELVRIAPELPNTVPRRSLLVSNVRNKYKQYFDN